MIACAAGGASEGGLALAPLTRAARIATIRYRSK
jgi:hypothetical protein